MKFEKTQLMETEKRKANVFNKKLFCILILSLFTSFIFAAEDGPNGVATVKKVFATIYEFFTSPAVRVIAIAGFIFTGIKIITNKGNTEMMKTMIPLCIACVIIGCASWIVGEFMGDVGENIDDLGTGWWK